MHDPSHAEAARSRQTLPDQHVTRLRGEDEPLLTGEARYVDDIRIGEGIGEGTLHAAFVRSPFAHANVRSVEISSALPAGAVLYTGRDLNLPDWRPRNCPPEFARPVLARDRVRFVGEPVAVIAAESRGVALDAAESVLVDYEPLDYVIDPRRALDDDVVLHELAGTNVAWRGGGGAPVDLTDAEVAVRGRFVNQRVAAVPIEPNAVVAMPDGQGIIVWMPSKAAFWARAGIAATLDLDPNEVRVIVPAVGGGFGPKSHPYPEQLAVAALAHRLGRPVRFVETRSESLISMNHGRGQVQDFELGARRDGTITGLRLSIIQDGGAYPDHAAFLAQVTCDMASGPYRIPAVETAAVCVATNTTPISSYRGAGRPEATAMIERAIDILAMELGMDPLDLRRRNLIEADAFPFETATGAVYDSGDYAGALEAAIKHVAYDEVRADQARSRARGDTDQIGIGISCYVEVTGFGSEYASIKLTPEGRFILATGVTPTGQGLLSSLSQIAATALCVPQTAVDIIHSDTALVARGEGTWGSRSLQRGGSAVFSACETLKRKATALASQVLEVDAEDIDLTQEGRFLVRGAPDRSLSWSELATLSTDNVATEGVGGLYAEADFGAGVGPTYPFGTHVAVVNVDCETGAVRLVRHVAVDDAGRIVNEAIARGQVQGGIAQGVGQALFEEQQYDETGTPLNGNLTTYSIPSATELPSFELILRQTETPLNPLGVKGIGESGVIGATPAIQNAVIDAIAQFGVRHLDMPLGAERVWQAIRSRAAGCIRVETE